MGPGRLGCVTLSTTTSNVRRVAEVHRVSGTLVTNRVRVSVTDHAIAVTRTPRHRYRGRCRPVTEAVTHKSVTCARRAVVRHAGREAQGTQTVGTAGTVIHVTVRAADGDAEGTRKARSVVDCMTARRRVGTAVAPSRGRQCADSGSRHRGRALMLPDSASPGGAPAPDRGPPTRRPRGPGR